MMDYKQMAELAMKEGDAILERKKRRAILIKRVSLTVSSLCAVAIVCFGVWRNDTIKNAFPHKDPSFIIDEQVTTTSTNASVTSTSISMDTQTTSINNSMTITSTTEAVSVTTNNKTTSQAHSHVTNTDVPRINHTTSVTHTSINTTKTQTTSAVHTSTHSTKTQTTSAVHTSTYSSKTQTTSVIHTSTHSTNSKTGTTTTIATTGTIPPITGTTTAQELRFLHKNREAPCKVNGTTVIKLYGFDNSNYNKNNLPDILKAEIDDKSIAEIIKITYPYSMDAVYLVKGISEGETTLTVTAPDGRSASINIQVKNDIEIKNVANEECIYFSGSNGFFPGYVNKTSTIEIRGFKNSEYDNKENLIKFVIEDENIIEDPTASYISPDYTYIRIKGISIGETTLTAITPDGRATSIKVIVDE